MPFLVCLLFGVLSQVLGAEGSKQTVELSSQGFKIKVTNESEGERIKTENEAKAMKFKQVSVMRGFSCVGRLFVGGFFVGGGLEQCGAALKGRDGYMNCGQSVCFFST